LAALIGRMGWQAASNSASKSNRVDIRKLVCNIVFTTIILLLNHFDLTYFTGCLRHADRGNVCVGGQRLNGLTRRQAEKQAPRQA
jgi:hypothetical protein